MQKQILYKAEANQETVALPIKTKAQHWKSYHTLFLQLTASTDISSLSSKLSYYIYDQILGIQEL